MSVQPNPRRLTAFAVLAGINEGTGGGGYGSVNTVGQIPSGVYEKDYAGGLREECDGDRVARRKRRLGRRHRDVLAVGTVTFFVISEQGVGVDFTLFPSIFAGGFVAPIGAPYVVRVVPNRVWSYLLPLYAFLIGLIGLAIGLGT